MLILLIHDFSDFLWFCQALRMSCLVTTESLNPRNWQSASARQSSGHSTCHMRVPVFSNSGSTETTASKSSFEISIANDQYHAYSVLVQWVISTEKSDCREWWACTHKRRRSLIWRPPGRLTGWSISPLRNFQYDRRQRTIMEYQLSETYVCLLFALRMLWSLWYIHCYWKGVWMAGLKAACAFVHGPCCF